VEHEDRVGVRVLVPPIVNPRGARVPRCGGDEGEEEEMVDAAGGGGGKCGWPWGGKHESTGVLNGERARLVLKAARRRRRRSPETARWGLFGDSLFAFHSSVTEWVWVRCGGRVRFGLSRWGHGAETQPKRIRHFYCS
jgi:hypothetical protein